MSDIYLWSKFRKEIYLTESERSKGCGTEVIAMIKRWCREHGYAELGTDTELTNIRAQQFYEHNGFEQVDRIVAYRLDLQQR